MLEKLRSEKWLLVLLLTWGVYFTLFWCIDFYWKGDTLYVNGISMWLDTPTFINTITSFKERSFWEWIETSPIHAYQKLRYFFLFPLIPSFIAKNLSIDSITMLQLFAIVINFVMLFSLYYLFKHLLKSGKKSFVAITLFFMAGGFNWIKWFVEFSGNYERIFTNHLYQYHPTIASTLIYAVMPSRSFCGGLSIAALLILYLDKFFSIKSRWINIVGVTIPSVLLVFIYPQSLLLVFFCALYMLVRDYKLNRPIAHWIWYGGLTTTLSFLWLWYYFRNEELLFGMQFNPFWFFKGKSFIDGVIFLIREFGIFYILAAWSSFKLRLWNYSIFAGIILFAFYCLAILQPNEYDNSRILLHAKLVFCIPVTLYLAKLWTSGKANRVICCILFFLLCFEPVINMVEILIPGRLTYPYLTKNDYAIANSFKRISAPNDIVLTPERRNNWVSLLAGRKIFMGGRQHVFSMGFPWEQMNRDAAAIYSGEKNAIGLLKKYQIRFVVFEKKPFYTPLMKQKFSNHLRYNISHQKNREFFEHNFKMILENSSYEIFQIY